MKDPHDRVTYDLFDSRYDRLSCLDAAYERKAIDEGSNTTPVFYENIEYLRSKQHLALSEIAVTP